MKRKNKVKVSIKKKRKPKQKSLMPQELSSGRPDIQQKLGKRRNKAAVLEEDGSNAELSDDDLRQAEGKQRRDGKQAPLQRLTAHQTEIVKRLVDAHDDNLEAMVKDRKLNAMLLPASKLRKMVASYKKFGSSKGRHGFRVPQKRLW